MRELLFRKAGGYWRSYSAYPERLGMILKCRITGFEGFTGLLRKLPVHPENLVYPVDSRGDIFP